MRTVHEWTGRIYTVYKNSELILKDAVPAEKKPDRSGWYRVIILATDEETAKHNIKNFYWNRIWKLRSETRNSKISQNEKAEMSKTIEKLKKQCEEEVSTAHETYASDTYLFKDGVWYTGNEDNNDKAVSAARLYGQKIKNAETAEQRNELRIERDNRIRKILHRSMAGQVIAYSREPVLEYTECYVEDTDSAVRLIGANIEETLREYRDLLKRKEPARAETAAKWHSQIREHEKEIRDQLTGYSTGADPEQIIEQYREKYGGHVSKRKLQNRQEIHGKVDLTEAKRKIAEANAKSTGKKADPLKWNVFGGAHEDH